MTIQTNATIQPPAAGTAARGQEIRRRLPGQARRQRLDTARLEYGPLYSLAEIQQRVAQTLFSAFRVVTPAYFSQKQVDPWIVAQVDGAELYAVIAQWDDAEELGR